jgi:hypothetical protein
LEQPAVAGLAASANGRPAVDFCDLAIRKNQGRNASQHAAYNNALKDVCSNGPRMGRIPNSPRAKDERPDNKGADHISEDGAVHKYQNSISLSIMPPQRDRALVKMMASWTFARVARNR